MSSLRRNLGYQTVYQCLVTCLPLITAPYLARILGATQQGVFSYTQSIINYFVLFSMLGVVNYGTRTIAKCNNDIRKRSEIFWNIYAIQFVCTIIAIIGYGIYMVFFCKDNWIISIIQCFYIIGALVDINWLFFGMEKFEITVKRNIIIKLLSVLLILTLVNQPEDLWIYTVIMAGGTVISNLILWCFLPRVVSLHAVKHIDIKKVKLHIKPNLVLFIPILAMSVYHMMDKTMLGLLSTYEQVGFYYNADKVINIPIGIINGIGIVMLPKMSALVEKGESKESIKLFNMSIEMISVVSVAMAFGIAAISPEFTLLFFGEGFEPCIILIIMLAPVLVIKSLSNTFRMQYLIPNHCETIFIQSVFAGAIVNFIFNLYLISNFGAAGAVIGTLVAETVTCAWQYIRMKKMINIQRSLLQSSIYLLFGLTMMIMVRSLVTILPTGIMGVACEIGTGGCIYLFLCVLFWKYKRHPFLSILKLH